MKDYPIFYGGGGWGKETIKTTPQGWIFQHECGFSVARALSTGVLYLLKQFSLAHLFAFTTSHAHLWVWRLDLSWPRYEYAHICMVFFHCCYFRIQVCVITDMFCLSRFTPSSNVYAVLVLQACSWAVVISWKFRRFSLIYRARIFD